MAKKKQGASSKRRRRIEDREEKGEPLRRSEFFCMFTARLSMRAMRRDFVPIARNVSMKLNVLPFRGFAGAFNIYNAVTYVSRAHARAQKLNNVHLRARSTRPIPADRNTAMYANAFLSSFIRSRLRRRRNFEVKFRSLHRDVIPPNFPATERRKPPRGRGV